MKLQHSFLYFGKIIFFYIGFFGNALKLLLFPAVVGGSGAGGYGTADQTIGVHDVSAGILMLFRFYKAKVGIGFGFVYVFAIADAE